MSDSHQRVSGAEAWSVRRRIVVSCLLALHLAAVVSAPWAGPPPSPQLAREVQSLFRPYQILAYLNHGYRFFAPDPGPSHVVRYEIELPDGKRLQGRIPDPATDWPRLAYHRHFMLAETLFNCYTQIPQEAAPETLTAQQKQEWQQQASASRELVQRLAEAMAQQLLLQHGGRRVRLYLQEHLIPFPEDVEAGMRLDDPSLYQNVAEFGPFERGAS